MQRDSITGHLHTHGQLTAGLSVGGGTTDYNELENKPSINGDELVGNMNLWQPFNIIDDTEIDTGFKYNDKKIYVKKINVDNLSLTDNVDYFFNTNIIGDIISYTCNINNHFFGNVFIISNYNEYIRTSKESNNRIEFFGSIPSWYLIRTLSVIAFYTKQ